MGRGQQTGQVRTVRHVHENREGKLEEDEGPDGRSHAFGLRQDAHDWVQDPEGNEHGHSELEDAFGTVTVNKLRE